MDEKAAEVTELFPDLPPPGLRHFEITATLPGRDCPAMLAIVAEDEIEGVLGTALDSCLKAPMFELKIRPLA